MDTKTMPLRVGLQQAKSSARRRVAEVPVMTAHQAQISPKNLTRSFGSELSSAKACPPTADPRLTMLSEWRLL